MEILQKAINEAQLRAYLSNEAERVAGFVLRAGDVAGPLTPAQLYSAHGLGFPGSPWRKEADYVDVVRFRKPYGAHLHDAISPEFVDRPPFTGTGFTTWDEGIAPLYFLDEVRMPAGAEIWRIDGSGVEHLRAVYSDISMGWQAVGGDANVAQNPAKPSQLIGWKANWRGQEYLADLTQNADSVVLLSREVSSDHASFILVPRGLYATTVPISEVDDLFESEVTCTYLGLPCRVVDIIDGERGRLLVLSYVGHNADLADAMELTKADAGVYFATASESQIDGLQAFQNRYQGLPGTRG